MQGATQRRPHCHRDGTQRPTTPARSPRTAVPRTRTRPATPRTPPPRGTTRTEPAATLRLERVLRVPLTEDAPRQWPRSGTALRGRADIARVEARAGTVRFALARRHARGDALVAEWSADYGDGRVHRDLTVAEFPEGVAVRIADYGGHRTDRPTAKGHPPRPSPPAGRLWPAPEDLPSP